MAMLRAMMGGIMMINLCCLAVPQANAVELENGDFTEADAANPLAPAGWEIGPEQQVGEAVMLTDEQAFAGDRSLLLRRTASPDYFYYLRQAVELESGAIYRLRFQALADEKAADALAVCLHVEGEEGPFWLYRPVHLQPGGWQFVEIIFRAQSGFNPLHSALVEFRLNQWRPDYRWRPNRPQDRPAQQRLHLDAVSLEPLPAGEAAAARLSGWLVVPGHDDLRMAEVEFGLGDGIAASEGSLQLSRDGQQLQRVEFLEEIAAPGQDPHPLLNGTARTTEIMLAFAESGSDAGAELARAFRQPTILASDQWYCASRGFMGDALVPQNPHTVATYDRIIQSYVENNLEPYPPGVDDCGLMNFGDFTYTGYNVWLNLEYDADLGLYMHFARSGDRRAFIRGLDGSRHFLDADTGWHTGVFDTHGVNFPHNVAHYNSTRPGGHIYTLGLVHYYLLTGDRRGLEATRLAADAVKHVLYHRIHQYSSAFAEDDPVGVWRGYTVPGGPSRSANSRETSDPARYALHTYLVTGEPRFLDAARSLADALALTWNLHELKYYIDGERVFHEERVNYEIPTGELWGLPVGTMAVDEIRIYSVALEADRIAALARGE